MSDINYMDVAEFREFGYLQEINRRLLHPLGLAIEVIVNDDGTESLGGIWDYRDDPEGMNYGPQFDLTDKAQRVSEEMLKRRTERQFALGYWIQPWITL